MSVVDVIGICAVVVMVVVMVVAYGAFWFGRRRATDEFLPVAQGDTLDRIASLWGLRRQVETDVDLRARIMRERGW